MKTYLHKLVMVVFFQLALCPFFAHASCFNVQPLHDFYAEQGRKVSYGGHFSSLESALSHVQSVAATHGGSPSYSNVNTGNGAFQVAYVSYYTPDGNLFYYTTWNTDNPIACETDTDGDGIADKYDLNPDSDTPYNAAIVSVCYDANNNIVAGILQDDQGNRFMFGTMPNDLEGHTIESVEGNSINYKTGEAIANAMQNLGVDVNLTPLEGSNIDVQDDGTIIPGTSDPLADWKKKEEDQITAPTPDTQDAPSHQPQENDTDSKHFENIVKNTDATNKNLQNITKSIGISNDLLAKINAKTVEAMDINLAQMDGGNEYLIAKLDEMRASDQATSETGKTALENFDIETALGDNINGELVEGEDGDYQKPGDLIEETWVQEALNTNPIKTALSNSGFSYGSSSATATLDLGYLGTHTLDIQPLEPGFILFGNLLVGMVTLAGFVYVATGRGF